MRQIAIGLGQALAMGSDQTFGEAHSGGNRDLLSQHRADCQLEAVPGAGHPQPRPGLYQRRQRRIFSKVGGDGYGIGHQVEHAPQPRYDGWQSREFRKSHRRTERVAVGALDRDRSLHAIQLHGPRVNASRDALDTGNGALAQKRQHGCPVVRRMIAQQEADLAMPPCRDFVAACAPQITGRTTKQRQECFVESADAAEPCGKGDLSHRQVRFMDELFGEQNAAGLGDGDG